MLHAPFKAPSLLRNYGVPAAITGILLSSFSPTPVLLTGLVLWILVVLRLVEQGHTRILNDH